LSDAERTIAARPAQLTAPSVLVCLCTRKTCGARLAPGADVLDVAEKILGDRVGRLALVRRLGNGLRLAEIAADQEGQREI